MRDQNFVIKNARPENSGLENAGPMIHVTRKHFVTRCMWFRAVVIKFSNVSLTATTTTTTVQQQQLDLQPLRLTTAPRKVTFSLVPHFPVPHLPVLHFTCQIFGPAFSRN